MQLPHTHPASQPTARNSPFATADGSPQTYSRNVMFTLNDQDPPFTMNDGTSNPNISRAQLDDGTDNPNISHSVIPDPSAFDPSFYYGSGAFYVVTCGAVLGIFNNWDNARSASSGYSGGSAIRFGSWDATVTYYTQVWEADNCRFTQATPRKTARQGSVPPPSPTAHRRGATPTPSPVFTTSPTTPRRAVTPMVPTSPTTPRHATPVVFPQSPTTPRFAKLPVTPHRREATPVMCPKSSTPSRELPGHPNNPIFVPSPTPTPGRSGNPIVVSSAAPSPASGRGTSPIVFTSPVPTRSLIRPTRTVAGSSKLASSKLASSTHHASTGTQTHPVFLISPLSPRATTIPIRVTGVISKSDLDAQITNALAATATGPNLGAPSTTASDPNSHYYEDVDEDELLAMCKAAEEVEARFSSMSATVPPNQE